MTLDDIRPRYERRRTPTLTKDRIMRKLHTLLLCGAALALHAPADAGSFSKCSNGKSYKAPKIGTLGFMSLRVHIGTQESDAFGVALKAVRDRWNNSPANMIYGLSFNDIFIGEGNGQSEFWWSNNISPPAVTKSWVYCSSGTIAEADVIFRPNVGYSTSETKTNVWPYGGAWRPFQTTAMHELGHVQGLAHTSNTYSIMGQDWDHIHANGSLARAYPGEDAVATSMAGYGKKAGAKHDLGVAHWRRTGSSGGYSAHARTRMFTSGGALLSSFTSGGEPVYYVAKGQLIRLEMTYENMGPSTLTAGVGYYVSTNDYISIYDTYLGAGSVTVGPNSANTTSNTYLYIPSNLQSGKTYWIGAIIDHNNQYSEVSEDNNRTYTAIRVL